MQSKRRENEEKIVFAPQDPDTLKAEEYMKKMVEVDKRGGVSLCIYAMFLFRKREIAEAEKLFIESLNKCPDDGFSNLQYLNFLDQCDLVSEADKLYSLMIRNIVTGFVSPIDGKDVGSTVKFYYKDDFKMFKTILLNASDTTFEVGLAMAKALKIPYSPSRGQIGMADRDSSDVISNVTLFDPHQFPWIACQRRKQKGAFLLFKRNRIQSRDSLRPILLSSFSALKNKVRFVYLLFK